MASAGPDIPIAIAASNGWAGGAVAGTRAGRGRRPPPPPASAAALRGVLEQLEAVAVEDQPVVTVLDDAAELDGHGWLPLRPVAGVDEQVCDVRLPHSQRHRIPQRLVRHERTREVVEIAAVRDELPDADRP